MPLEEVMKHIKRIYDAIHGFIKLTEPEVKILDTCVLQRLRRIKQLGPAEYVYPTATHTRFSHSLGTLFVASRMLEHLSVAEEEVQQSVRLAALIHDIGHFPFSHALEYISHEKLTLRLAKRYLEELVPEYIKDVISVLSGTHELSTLISSEIDADRLDYLVRDAYFTGVKYGVIDLEKIIDSLTFVRHKHLSILAFKRGSEIALENLLISRYHMFRRVYYHEVVSSFEALLSRIFNELISENIVPSLEELFDNDLWCEFDDCMLLSIIRSVSKKYSKKWLGEACNMFLRRIPLKLAIEVPIYRERYVENKYMQLYDLWLDNKLVSALSDLSGVPEEWIIVYRPAISLVRKNGNIAIIGENGEIEIVGTRPLSLLDRLMNFFYSPLRIYTHPKYVDRLKGAVERLKRY